jgi:3-oxoacid CoA-transferase subunit A
VEKQMIYFTGDIHGSGFEVVRFCKRFHLTAADTVVILGDVGANYSLDTHDCELKAALNRLKPTIFCIHGNHEIRPSNIPPYITKEWNGGTVWYEEEFPNILFAKDGCVYSLEGLDYLVIGGAYSVDKFYRLLYGYGWWADEQPSKAIKAFVEKKIAEKHFDIVLSHTCPYKYEPVEAFLPTIDQSSVDDSTEKWLDTIESSIEYKAWFCGHWHINKRIDKMHFLFHDFESAEQFSGKDGDDVS